MENNIIELAKTLGQAIKADERILAMNEAKAVYDDDKKLQSSILEYNTQRAALGEEYKKETPDKEFIDTINNRINELYEAIVSNPVFLQYNETQEAVNAFMNEVNGEITYQITGERPCAHDCSSCHSDCSSHTH